MNIEDRRRNLEVSIEALKRLEGQMTKEQIGDLYFIIAGNRDALLLSIKERADAYGGDSPTLEDWGRAVLDVLG